jgi:cyclophilin family peptidyl-prolyl cis-trans isomerase
MIINKFYTQKWYIFRALCWLVCFSCLACSPKLNEQNVREELLKYGKENPETVVLISTKVGEIKCKLYAETPLHRANFIRLIKAGYYNDHAEFYRVIQRFMVQGGDLGKLSQRKENVMIPNEIMPTKFYHKRGALAMARSEINNPEKKSSATEFYLIQGSRYDSTEIADLAKQQNLTLSAEQLRIYTSIGGDASLDGKYTVFGEVVFGLEVIDKIAATETFGNDKPLKKIPFTVRVLE